MWSAVLLGFTFHSVCVCVWDAQGVDRIFPSASPPLPLESLCLSLVCFFPLSVLKWFLYSIFYIVHRAAICDLFNCDLPLDVDAIACFYSLL